MDEKALLKITERESRLAHLIMSRPEWANLDMQDVLHDLLVDIIATAKSENIFLYDLFHGAIGEYAHEASEESVYNEM